MSQGDDGKINAAALLVWGYHQLRHDLTPADLIWVLGSHDLRVADRAADLWKEGLAGRILMSGGYGNLTAGVFEESEAVLLARRAADAGIPPDAILIEDRSTNTGENVEFSRRLLEERGLEVSTVIAVQKPYMERRTWATIRKQWPEVEVRVTSPRFELDAYCRDGIDRELVIHTMVGDLDRIAKYPAMGFMVAQEIPAEVTHAFELLVAAGYDRHLLLE